jgi:hypothetical protein
MSKTTEDIKDKFVEAMGEGAKRRSLEFTRVTLLGSVRTDRRGQFARLKGPDRLCLFYYKAKGDADRLQRYDWALTAKILSQCEQAAKSRSAPWYVVLLRGSPTQGYCLPGSMIEGQRRKWNYHETSDAYGVSEDAIPSSSFFASIDSLFTMLGCGPSATEVAQK